jgi:hypothetical protein
MDQQTNLTFNSYNMVKNLNYHVNFSFVYNNNNMLSIIQNMIIPKADYHLQQYKRK